MTTVLDFLEALGMWSLPHLWLPLVAWTLVALAALALLRVWPAAHPLVQYRARQALLLALPLGLLAAAAAADLAAWLQPAESPAFSFTIVIVSAPAVEAAPAPAALDFTWWHALGLGTLAAAAAALLRLGRLLMQAAALARFRRTLPAAPDPAVPDPGVQRLTDRLAEEAGLRRRVRTLLAGGPLVPMTFGGRRPVIVLPAALASNDEDGNDERLRMALTHELTHVRRCDYLAHAAEQVVAALFAFHPLAGHLRRRIAACREQACDAAVLAGGRFSAHRYAALLLDLTGAPARPLAVPMTEPSHPLKDRLTAMKKHARRWNARPAPPRTGLLLGLALLLTAVLATACADLVSVSEEEAKPSASNQAAGQEVFMVEEDQPELIGGMEALYEKLEYPPMAREAGIQGRVFLQFVVDEEGRVTDPKILRSPHELLGEEALRVIRLMEFEPGTQQGEPVKVRLSIPITFRLQGEPPPPPTPAVQAERPDAALDVDEPLQQTPPPPPEPFMVVSDQPEMIGGMEALYDEIAYPAPARKAGIEGTVVVEFVVDEAGNVVSPTVVRGVHPALDAAALDAVRQVQFEPGRLEDGTPVQVKMALPIRFELSGGAGEAPGGTSSDA